MEPRNTERRKNKRYHLKKSPVVFCATLIGKVADISLGGIKMVHTGNPKRFLGGLVQLSILGKNFALEFPARLVGCSKVNDLVSLCRFQFDGLTEQKQEELRGLIKSSTFSLSLLH